MAAAKDTTTATTGRQGKTTGARAGYYDVVDGVLHWNPPTKATEAKNDDTPAS